MQVEYGVVQVVLTVAFSLYFNDILKVYFNSTRSPETVKLDIAFKNTNFYMENKKKNDGYDYDRNSKPEKEVAISLVMYLPPIQSKAKEG